MKLLVLCVFLSLLEIVSSTDPNFSSAEDQQGLLRSILPDLYFDYNFRKSRDPPLCILTFYLRRLGLILGKSCVSVDQINETIAFDKYEFAKGNFKPGEVVGGSVEMVQLQSLDGSEDLVLVSGPDPSLLITHLHEEGEVLKNRNISITARLEGMKIDVVELEIQRKRIAFLKKTVMEEMFSLKNGHVDLIRMPAPPNTSSPEDIRPATLVQGSSKTVAPDTAEGDLAKVVLSLHVLILLQVLPYASRYESPSCAIRAHSNSFQTVFRQTIPTASIISMHEVTNSGQRIIGRVLVEEGNLFKGGTRVFEFIDKSYYVAEYDGYISGEFGSPRIEENIPFLLPFIIYPKLQKTRSRC